jgi:peptidoglycan/LPS O-acetylase OafA/YrhL
LISAPSRTLKRMAGAQLHPLTTVQVNIPADPHRAARATHVAELDGLRGIAVLLVLLYHFSVVLTYATGPIRALRTVFTPGWTGVDLFFVLSGCLITGILLDEKGSRDYFRRFYIRRVLRICPVYYLALLVSFTVARTWVLPAGGVPAATSLAYFFNFSNWLSLHGREIEALNHYWSLAVEEQFYLTFPLAVFLLSRKALLRLLTAVIVLAPLVRFLILSTVADPEIAKRIAYVLTPARADGLAFGAIVAIVLRHQRLRAAVLRYSGPALAAIVALLLAWFGVKGRLHLESPATLSLLYTLLAGAYALIVLRASDGAGGAAPVQKLLRLWLLRRAGRYSYAAYVFHFPLLFATMPLFLALSERGRHIVALPWFLAGIAVTFLLARISWSLMEQPILRLKPVLAPSPQDRA